MTRWSKRRRRDLKAAFEAALRDIVELGCGVGHFTTVLVLSVMAGTMIAASMVVFGHYFGQIGMMAGYAAICLFIMLPWATAVLKHWPATFHTRSCP